MQPPGENVNLAGHGGGNQGGAVFTQILDGFTNFCDEGMNICCSLSGDAGQCSAVHPTEQQPQGYPV